MVKRALIERRPWLLLSIVSAIVWWLAIDGTQTPGAYQLVLKGVPVGLLAVYAWQRLLGTDGTLVALTMLVAAIGDALITLEYGWGGLVHALSQLIVIALYWRNHRPGVKPAVMASGLAAVVVAPVLAWFLMVGETGQGAVAASAALLAITAAMAWLSRFPRQRVGLGALLYLLSELLLIAVGARLVDQGGALEQSARELVWPLYYIGQLLVTTGIVTTLRNERR
ncbi:lysoplasmalogenase family protein [Croceicoccus sp. Ery5]|uniref:lysoplasmalogenase family protein n=1 Tax=Croceicoccus sp. Ery5 TaxID=1703340 RepID=UPI001E2B6598|nr:lysoplasmalogenase family protein [Croceicoccus sp. Ery5]